MDKTVIILKENQNRGKTSTLNFLVEILKGIATGPCINAPAFPDVDDYAIVIPIEGIRIGIVTLGDPGYEEQFLVWLDFCVRHQSDVIVVATRTQETVNGKRAPYGLIWDFINKEAYKTFETSPYMTYAYHGEMDRAELNKLCAQSLFNTIQSLIK